MPRKQTIPIIAALALLLTVTSIAMFYRGRAEHYRAQAIALEAEMEARAVLPEPVSAEPVPVRESLPEPDPAEDSENDALRAHIAELERQLAEGESIRPYTAAQPDEPARERPQTRRDWMEELRQNDPERYEEIQQRRAEFQRRTQESFARRAAYLLYRDTESLTEAEREEYDLMISLLTESWMLNNQLQSITDREERREVMRTMVSNWRTLQPLLDNERERVFVQMGRDFGYGEDEAQAFAEQLNDLIDITTLRGFFRGGGTRGPRNEP